MFRKLAVIGVALLLQASPSTQTQPVGTAGSSNVKPGSFDQEIQRHAQQMIEEGRKIFRFDTFGDEAFWGDQLKLHQAIAGAKFGGVGPGLSPAKATPLRGLFTREKGGFYHDGRFKTLDQVVQHYEKTLELKLTDQQKRDLVQYLKSL